MILALHTIGGAVFYVNSHPPDKDTVILVPANESNNHSIIMDPKNIDHVIVYNNNDDSPKQSYEVLYKWLT